LIRVRNDFGGRGVGACAVSSSRKIGQRVARDERRDCGTDRNRERISRAIRKLQRINALALFSSGYWDDLRGAKNLTEALIFAEEKSLVASVINMRDRDGTANGDAKLVAREGRDAAGIHRGSVVEKIARVERGVAQKFERAAMNKIGAGFCDNVGEARRAVADLRGYTPELDCTS